MKTLQKVFDLQKPYVIVIKGKITEKNIPVKVNKKINLVMKKLNKYENAFSPTQEKKIKNEILRRNPWVKNFI